MQLELQFIRFFYVYNIKVSNWSSPIANVISDGAFSGLKRIQTYLRLVMTQDRPRPEYTEYENQR